MMRLFQKLPPRGVWFFPRANCQPDERSTAPAGLSLPVRVSLLLLPGFRACPAAASSSRAAGHFSRLADCRKAPVSRARRFLVLGSGPRICGRRFSSRLASSQGPPGFMLRG